MSTRDYEKDAKEFNNHGCDGPKHCARCAHLATFLKSRDERIAAQARKAAFEEVAKGLDGIIELDPCIHSAEGFNEWGEADCFKQAQHRARVLKDRLTKAAAQEGA